MQNENMRGEFNDGNRPAVTFVITRLGPGSRFGSFMRSEVEMQEQVFWKQVPTNHNIDAQNMHRKMREFNESSIFVEVNEI